MKKLISIFGILLSKTSCQEIVKEYPTNYDVSRSNKQVKYVYQISAQGSHAPKKLLNLVKNSEDEPKYPDYVTPLGIRQQYMIGDELRLRYVEEQNTHKFMDELYNITQIYIQTSWNDTAILSAQAMLLGLYPPGKNNYKIEESQKYNAVPPVEGFDFKPWIDEMGLEALPYQTTIFPIQMNGWSYDYLLATDNQNCPKRGAARDEIKAQIDNNIQDIVSKSSLPANVKNYFKQDWESFCDYIIWAYTESVELIDNLQDVSFETCLKCRQNQTIQFSQLENQKLQGVSTNDLRMHMKNQINKWIGVAPGNNSQSLSQSEEARRKKISNLEGTAGTENPQFIMFWTNEQQLELIAQQLSSDLNLTSSLLPLTPSSTIILELTQNDSTKDLDIQLYVNDQLLTSTFCENKNLCSAKSFASNLENSIKIKDDVSQYCNSN